MKFAKLIISSGILVSLAACKTDVRPVEEPVQSEVQEAMPYLSIEDRYNFDEDFCPADYNKLSIKNALLMARLASAAYSHPFVAGPMLHELGFGTKEESESYKKNGLADYLIHLYHLFYEQQMSNTKDPHSVITSDINMYLHWNARELHDRFLEMVGRKEGRKYLEREFPRYNNYKSGFDHDRKKYAKNIHTDVFASNESLRGRLAFYSSNIHKGSWFCGVFSEDPKKCGYVRADNQFFWAENDNDVVIGVRGTEADSRLDIFTDIGAFQFRVEGEAKIKEIESPSNTNTQIGSKRPMYVHAGFYSAAEEAWNGFLKKKISQTPPDKGIWLTGHSLGGAVVTILAYKIMREFPQHKLRGVYTYGSPRVGDEKFKNFVEAKGLERNLGIFRFRLGTDPVARIPSDVFYGESAPINIYEAPYQHIGTYIHLKDDYFDRKDGIFGRTVSNRDSAIPEDVGVAIVYCETCSESKEGRIRFQRKPESLLEQLDFEAGINRLIANSRDHSVDRYYDRIKSVYDKALSKNEKVLQCGQGPAVKYYPNDLISN